MTTGSLVLYLGWFSGQYCYQTIPKNQSVMTSVIDQCNDENTTGGSQGEGLMIVPSYLLHHTGSPGEYILGNPGSILNFSLQLMISSYLDLPGSVVRKSEVEANGHFVAKAAWRNIPDFRFWFWIFYWTKSSKGLSQKLWCLSRALSLQNIQYIYFVRKEPSISTTASGSLHIFNQRL